MNLYILRSDRADATNFTHAVVLLPPEPNK